MYKFALDPDTPDRPPIAPLSVDAPSRAAEVLVLGGGIVGSAVAYHLERRGAEQVVLVTTHPANNATLRSAGISTTVGWDPWDLDLVQRSDREYSEITERGGAGSFRRVGGFRVARSADGIDWLGRVREALESFHVPAQMISGAQLADLIPGVGVPEESAVLTTPRDAVFDAAELAEEYLAGARRGGVEVIGLEAPGRLERADSAWVVRCPGVTVRAARVVVACGAWTKSVLAQVGVSLPVAPFRTQVAQLRPSPMRPEAPTLHDLDLQVYVRRLRNGRVWIGNGNSPSESTPLDSLSSGDAAFDARMRESWRTLHPHDAAVTVERSWAGWCVATPDRFPLIGPVPQTKGLVVATGFNGTGAMRAGAVGRHLAHALESDDWAPLHPARPNRFPLQMAPFDPRPEFPLEAPLEEWGGLPAPPAAYAVSELPPPEEPVSAHRIGGLSELEGVRWPSLSEWFDPFLPIFVADALRTGGWVELAVRAGVPVGVFLFSPSEGVASLFTRARSVALRFLPRSPSGGVYAEDPWIPGGETIEVMAGELADWRASDRFRNPVRVITEADYPKVGAAMREWTGATDDSWFRSLPRREEVGFLCEVDGHVAGLSWATVAGRHARGHSFMVHPRYRGLGIGTDLLQARMLWLRDHRVERVVSEIYGGNTASRTAAERAGMSVIGKMYHLRPSPSGRGAGRRRGLRSGAPRTSDSSSRSSR